VDENHNHSLGGDGVAVRALRNCVNNNTLGGHLLLINHRFIREVAHHITGLLLLSSVARIESHRPISVVEPSCELSCRVDGELSTLVGVHRVHRLHHHLHLLLLLELVVSTVVVVTLVSRRVELVSIVHVTLEHHLHSLLLVVLLEEGVGRLGQVSAPSRHHVASTSAIVEPSTAVAATPTATSGLVARVALVARD